MKNALLASCAAALLASCATEQKFAALMNTWIGSSEGALVAKLGAPNGSYTVNEHEKVLTYTRSNQVMMPGPVYSQPVMTNTYGNVGMTPFNATTTSYLQQQGAPMMLSFSCTVNFAITDGIVKSWSAQGNNCQSR